MQQYLVFLRKIAKQFRKGNKNIVEWRWFMISAVLYILYNMPPWLLQVIATARARWLGQRTGSVFPDFLSSFVPPTLGKLWRTSTARTLTVVSTHFLTAIQKGLGVNTTYCFIVSRCRRLPWNVLTSVHCWHFFFQSELYGYLPYFSGSDVVRRSVSQSR